MSWELPWAIIGWAIVGLGIIRGVQWSWPHVCDGWDWLMARWMLYQAHRGNVQCVGRNHRKPPPWPRCAAMACWVDSQSRTFVCGNHKAEFSVFGGNRWVRLRWCERGLRADAEDRNRAASFDQ